MESVLYVKGALQAAFAGAAAPAQAQTVLPTDTTISVAPVNDITSKKMKEGDEASLQVVNDVLQNGVVVIARGAPVKGTITWRTDKGIGGKSAKFEVTFVSVKVGGRDWAFKVSIGRTARAIPSPRCPVRCWSADARL